MSKSNILVIGAFGYDNNQLDGQTIKTRNIVSLLNDHPQYNVKTLDTLKVRGYRAVFYVIRLLLLLLMSDYVILVPADNSMEKLLPVLYRVSLILRHKLIVICVGGWQIDFFEGTYKFKEHKYLIELCKSLHAFLPEMENVNRVLVDKYHFDNCQVFPNFRYVQPFLKKENISETLKLVFMARINKNKGYDALFNLSEFLINNKMNVKIDFYGQIDSDDCEDFLSKVKSHSANVSYCGFLKPNEIHERLSNYDVLLLPTKYYTEGFPGSILDAYIAGIPVIVTEWKHSHEFVREGESGFIIPFEDGQNELNSIISKLYSDRDLLSITKNGAAREALKYSPDSAWNILSKYL